MFKYAITRTPGKDFASGITTVDFGKPNYQLILAQHENYKNILKNLGLQIINLEPLDAFPDSYFVEDTAIVMPELAIITNPGADSRKGEVPTIRAELSKHKEIEEIIAPGTVDGGDVFFADKRFFVGISKRTNEEGARQLSHIVKKYGYTSSLITVPSGLHLKCFVNYVGRGYILTTEEFANHEALQDYKIIVLAKGEEYASNTLLVNNHLIMPEGFPKTMEALKVLEMPIITINNSECRKMDGALTCMSLRF